MGEALGWKAMVVKRTWLAGIGAVVLVLAAAGCSGEPDDVAASEQAVIDEALAAAGVSQLPLDQYWLPEDQRVAFEQKLLPKVIECVAARGFTVTPEYEVAAEPSSVQTVLRYGIVGSARAKKHAYNPTPQEHAMSQTPHRALPILLGSVVTDEAMKAILGESVSAADGQPEGESADGAASPTPAASPVDDNGDGAGENVAEEGQDQGCYGKVLAEMTDVTDARAYHDLVSGLGELTVKADGEARAAQGTVEAGQKWGECMRGKGYAEATDPWDVYSLVGADPAQTPEEPGEFAIDVAVADVECKQETGFTSAYVAELVKTHQAAVEENSTQLTELDKIHQGFTVS